MPDTDTLERPATDAVTRVDRDALLTAVRAVYQTVERRNTIPILGNVHLWAKPDALRVIATDMDEEPDIGERERLEQVIVLCRKRVARADEKLAAAQAEREAASHALDGQQGRLAQWHKDNPDPQGSIFEELSNV